MADSAPAPKAPAIPPDDQYDHSDSDFNVEADLPLESIESPTPPPKPSEPAVSGPPQSPRRHPAGLVRRALSHGATKEEIDGATLHALDAWVEEQDLIRQQDRERNWSATA